MAGKQGAAWWKSPGCVPSTEVPQFNKSLEFPQTPAGQEGGLRDTADPSTTSPLWLIELDMLTAPHTC